MTESAAPVVLVTPHKFKDLSPEHEVLDPTGARIVACESQDEFERLAPSAEVLLVNAIAPIDRRLIATLGECKAIVRYGTGVNNVDVEAAAGEGIQVANVLDASIEDVANHALTLALALLRRVHSIHQATAAGEWPIPAIRGARRFSTLSAGIVGVGRIGSATAARFEALGFEVVASDPFAASAPWPLLPLDELLEQADVVSLHLPLSEQTHHLLGSKELNRMRPEAVLINVSRGGLVDEAALAERLAQGELAGAGFDVFEQEPLAADHPLCSAPNVLLTPHIAWYSEEASQEVQFKAAQEAARALAGQPLLSPVTRP